LKVLEDLVNTIEDAEIKLVFIGTFTTMVKSKHVGLSSTLKDLCQGEEAIKNAGSLTGRSTKELAEYVFSNKLIEASVGMASINSALDLSPEEFAELNAFDVIKEKGKNKNVAIIGHFPFVDRLRNFVKKLFVFEKRLKKGDLPDTKIPELLPEADVVAISGTVLINHTFDDVMKYIRKDAYKIMLGPSTPLSKIMFDWGIDLLAGSIVTDERKLLEGISQGVPFRNLNGKKFVTIKRYEN